MNCASIYHSADQTLIDWYLHSLENTGPYGKLGANLFRAQKAYTNGSACAYYYDQFDAAIQEITNIVRICCDVKWGWSYDGDSFNHILSIELYSGLIQFHTSLCQDKPMYRRAWQGSDNNTERLFRYCDWLTGMSTAPVDGNELTVSDQAEINPFCIPGATSLKDYLEKLLIRMDGITPVTANWKYKSAYDYLLKHGELFCNQSLPDKYRNCYRRNDESQNIALCLSQSFPELRYVEGVVLLRYNVFKWCAWCVNEDGCVICPGPSHLEHYGVIFDTDYVVDIYRHIQEFNIIKNWAQDYPLLRGLEPVVKAPGIPASDDNYYARIMTDVQDSALTPFDTASAMTHIDPATTPSTILTKERALAICEAHLQDTIIHRVCNMDWMYEHQHGLLGTAWSFEVAPAGPIAEVEGDRNAWTMPMEFITDCIRYNISPFYAHPANCLFDAMVNLSGDPDVVDLLWICWKHRDLEAVDWNMPIPANKTETIYDVRDYGYLVYEPMEYWEDDGFSLIPGANTVGFHVFDYSDEDAHRGDAGGLGDSPNPVQ